MKKMVTKVIDKGITDIGKLYEAYYSFTLWKRFNSEAKMNQWIENTKKKYSLNYEPEITIYEMVGSQINEDKLEVLYKEI